MLAYDEVLKSKLRILLRLVRPGTYVLSTGNLHEEFISRKNFNDADTQQSSSVQIGAQKRKSHLNECLGGTFETLDFTMQPFSWGLSALWIHRRTFKKY